MRKVRVGFPVFTKFYRALPGFANEATPSPQQSSDAGHAVDQVVPNMMKMFLRLFVIGFGALLAATSAHDDCFDEAAKYQKVNPLILLTIA
ncbi:MAG: Putative IpgF protein [uncultured Caballeronia sp.]|nr:MAG: Putative IpgF protein [uncultured Caballeronia sp.]